VRLTGTKDVPELKQRLGYAYEPSKFEVAGLTAMPLHTVVAPRVLECPVQMEAVLSERHDIMADDPNVAGLISAFELRITCVHVHPSIIMPGHETGSIKPMATADHEPPEALGFSSVEIISPPRSNRREIYRMPDVDRSCGEALERAL
jgi:flavin reductase (DIM6/NTAB) family NADH-FMN oxidoreductase RutF